MELKEFSSNSVYSVPSVARLIQKIRIISFDPQKCIENAKRFDVSIFKEKMMKFISEKWEEHKKR